MIFEAQVAAFLSTLLLLGAFILAHQRNPTDFAWYWIVGWSFYVIRFGLDMTETILGESYLISVGVHEAISSSGILLLLAVLKLQYPERDFRQKAFLGWIGLSTLVVVVPLLTDEFIIIHGPLFFAFGVIQLSTAYFFYQYLAEYSYVSTPLIVGSMAIWGIHKLDYPFLRPIRWIAPYGYTLGAILALLTGLGVVFFLLEDTERVSRERGEQIMELSEMLEAVSSVNQRLVKAEQEVEVIPDIAEILAESSVFGCVFIYLIEDSEQDFVCSEGSDLEVTQVNEIHTDSYIQTVFDEGILHIEDVTTKPYQQHFDQNIAPHEGIGLKITHNSTDFGILTVHFPEWTPKSRHINLLSDLADDIGFTLNSLRIERERKEALEELRAQRENLLQKNRVVEEAPVGIVITDPRQKDNPIIYANPQSEKLTGFSQNEMVGRNCRFLQGEQTDPETTRRIQEAFKAREPVSVDVKNYRKDGSEFWNHLEISPVRDEDGSVINFVVFQQDVTERTVRDRHIEIVDRIFRHNIRNELTVIQGNAQSVMRKGSPSVENLSRKILDSSENLLTLANKARQMNQLLRDDSDPARLSTQSFIEESVSSLQDQFPEATFHIRTDAECPVRAHPSIGIAISELLENTVIHNPDPAPTVELNLDCDQTTVTIEILDNGPGIPKVEREIIEEEREIDPLNHSDGIGLRLAEWIVRESDGRLEITTRKEGGSRAIIRLLKA